MKIDHDLRQAIKAACKKQPRQQSSWEIRERVWKEAMLTLPESVKKTIAAKQKEIEKAKLTISKAQIVLTELGLNYSGECIEDEEKFLKAGGKLVKPERNEHWTEETAIARIAAAAPTDGAAILKEYGIDWT
jgi:hypothetical protein